MAIRHIVLMKLRRETDQATVDAIDACLADLPREIEGITGYAFGVNGSPEGLGFGFDHGFTMDFANAAARDRYLPHPAHEACGQAIQAATEAVLVFDLEL